MGKKQRIVLAGLLAVVLGGLAWLVLSQPREPSYQGKLLSVWLQQYSTNRWPLDKQAGDAIRHIGTNATPILLKMMSTHESPAAIYLLSHIPKPWRTRLQPLPSLNDYQRGVDEYRSRGASGFMALGADAKPAVPALIALLNDKNQRVRYLAVFALRCLGPVANDALPSLMECLKDPEFTIRDEAIMGLGIMHREPKRVIPELMKFLDYTGPDWIQRSDAIGALRQFGAQAKPAVPLLLGSLNNPEATIRSAATNALKAIDPEAAAKAGIP